MVDITQLESAIWSIADGQGTDDDRALLRAGGQTALSVLDGLIQEAEDGLESVRNLSGDERDQVVGDFVDTIRGLRATADVLRYGEVRAPADGRSVRAVDEQLPPDPVALQASWANGRIIVWAGARGATPEPNEALATRLELCGGPAHGWEVHPGIPLGRDVTAEALSIAVEDGLGWLVAVNGQRDTEGLGASLRVAQSGCPRRRSDRGAWLDRPEARDRRSSR